MIDETYRIVDGRLPLYRLARHVRVADGESWWEWLEPDSAGIEQMGDLDAIEELGGEVT